MISSPLSRMYMACAEPITLASQLASARELPPADVLQRRISMLFDQMHTKCREAGFTDEDANDAKYAIAAFADEQIFRSQWPGRHQWMGQPLQLVYFRENTAGEGFFRRMAHLQAQPQRAHVLEIYYLCLCLGFQGQYAVRGGEGIGPIVSQVAVQLGAAGGSGENISPHGEPRDALRGLMRRERPLVALSIVFVALAIITFVVLKLVLAGAVSSAARDMAKANPPAAALQTAPAQR